jgi:hypothetical protein
MDKFDEKSMITVFIRTFLSILVMSIGFSILLTYPVMWLWNWLMPAIFGLKTLTFWQTFGLTMLSNMIFGKVNVKN